MLEYIDEEIKENLFKELCECKTSEEMDKVFDKYTEYLNRIMIKNNYEDLFLLKTHMLDEFMGDPEVHYSSYQEITPEIEYELSKQHFLIQKDMSNVKCYPENTIKDSFEFSKEDNLTPEQFAKEYVLPLAEELMDNYKKDKKVNISVKMDMNYII